MLDHARRAGVHHFLTVGVDADSSLKAIELAAGREGVVAAIGVHPTRVGPQSSVDGLRDLAQRPGVVALGEVGLDDSADPGLMPHQELYFRACLQLAQELDLPLSLHILGAPETHRRAQKMLASRSPLRAVVHYFQGDWPLAEAYLALGCHISVGKPVTRPERSALRDALRHVPLDRLLLETDTYPLPGRTTEPSDVVDVCRAVAELKRLCFAQVANTTTKNYLSLFRDNRPERSS